MFIASLHVEGLADLPEFRIEGLQRCVHLRGPTPQTTAVGDAIALAFAAFSPAACERLLRRWGVVGPQEEPEFMGELCVAQAHWKDRYAARRLVYEPDRRSIVVTIKIELDPLLFRQLRDEAVRDPRLVAALAGGAHLELSVGALFATSFDALALSLRGVRIGSERFPTLEKDRPVWLTRVLSSMSHRFHQHVTGDGLAMRVMEAATSREHYDRYQSWQAHLEPKLGVVRPAWGPGGMPVLLADEQPLIRWGRAGFEAAALAASVYLEDPDVLWVETEDVGLAEVVQRGALEQIWLVSERGDVVVEPLKSRPRKAARFPTREE